MNSETQESKIAYIYAIHATDECPQHTSQRYVGSTTNPLRRFHNHVSASRKTPNRRVYREVAHCGGWDAVTMTILHEVQVEGRYIVESAEAEKSRWNTTPVSTLPEHCVCGHRRRDCRSCGGRGICAHNRRRRDCKVCRPWKAYV